LTHKTVAVQYDVVFFCSLQPSSHSDTLLQLENGIKEHEDTLPHPKDIFSKPGDIFSLLEDAPQLHEDTLPHPDDSLSLSQPTDATMLGGSRSKGLDVHIFDASDPNTTIGGLILTNGVTNINLYTMVEIIVIFESEFALQNEDNITIPKDNDPLQPGNYYIHSIRKFLYSGSLSYR
jgi:hypothetical protein